MKGAGLVLKQTLNSEYLKIGFEKFAPVFKIQSRKFVNFWKLPSLRQFSKFWGLVFLKIFYFLVEVTKSTLNQIFGFVANNWKQKQIWSNVVFILPIIVEAAVTKPNYYWCHDSSCSQYSLKLPVRKQSSSYQAARSEYLLILL